ncbi:MAG: 2-oxo acid dehydrogenase subunit E2 [Pseudomonadota bacterium]|nr:2-oxo acid dehydrogenase subunit E2 [Pseudomonadota bacterium]
MPSPIEVLVPDIGGFKDVNVIDVLVKNGQQVEKETPLVTIETEKAAMDVPSPVAGKIAEVKLKTGDKVSEGSLILLMEPAAAAATPADKPADSASPAESKPATKAEPASAEPDAAPTSAPRATAASPSAAPTTALKAATSDAAAPSQAQPSRETRSSAVDESAFSMAHASPSVRKFARELGTDLARITGTGVKGRITQDDVKAHVKSLLTAASTERTGNGLPRVPVVDFAFFGPVEVKPLSRIQKISGARLQASWLNLPHVTQHQDADISDLEAARGALKDKATQAGVRLTPLVFIIRACILALKEFPRFNASLDESGENLVLKKYLNIGFAADTPNGLVVPVIPNADRLDSFEIARTLAALSEKARAGKLKAAEMHGGSFTVSSLGGIGGTYFTPIINAPEVAILGVSKASQKPVYERGGFLPRLMLPLSLSYDHRVIDGAEAARFVVFLAKTLGDVKALL